MLKTLKKAGAVVFVLAMMALVATVTMPFNVSAAVGTTYYVDAVSGDDTNNGTSNNSPWKSLGKVNGMTFSAGDRILFKKGGSWTGLLAPKGSGATGNPIIIDSYGSGNKPLINGDGTNEAAVQLRNQDYWTIQNIAVTNRDPDPSALELRSGVKIIAEGAVVNGIHIKNVEVSDVEGSYNRAGSISFYFNAGIHIRMDAGTPMGKYDGVLVENCYVHDVDTIGIGFFADDNAGYGYNNSTWSSNITVRSNHVARTGADGILVGMAKSPLIEYNLVEDAGANGTAALTKVIAGCWAYNASDALFQYNEVSGTAEFTNDGQAFDLDWGAEGTWTFQYNYSRKNGGGTMLIMFPWGRYSTANAKECIFRYNIAENDATGHMFELHHGILTAYNNIVYGPEIPVNVKAAVRGNTFINNVFVGNAASRYNAGNNYHNNLYFGHNGPSDDNKIVADPKFINPGANEAQIDFYSPSKLSGYKLQADSPCINAGSFIYNNGGQDFWGTAIDGDNSTPDIGAQEYDGTFTAPTARNPLNKIQAEDWDYGISVKIEDGPGDEGKHIGFVTPDGYIMFRKVAFTDDLNTFRVRAGAEMAGGKVEIRLDSPDGTLIGTCDITTTGGWNDYADFTCDVNSPSGTHDLFLVFKKTTADWLFNVDWFQFSKTTTLDPYSKIQAENWDEEQGTRNEDDNADEGTHVGFTNPGDYIAFKNLDFDRGATAFKVRAAADLSGGKIEIRLGSKTGTLIGTCDVTTTGSWSTYADFTCNVTNTTGTQDVYLVFVRNNDHWLFNLDWFEFTAQ